MPTANYTTTPQTDWYGDDEENKPTPGVVTPQQPTSFNPAYGGKPAVPDPAAVLSSVIGSNLGMMPDIKGLGRKASKYFWNQTVGRVPGYEDMAAQSAKNIGSLLRGEVPEDVLYQLGQGAAERGIARGGGFSNADYIRSLGLTSLGLMGEGEKGLTGALQRAESIPLFDISKYMLNPQDVYQGQLLANVLASAPNPAAAAAAARSAVSGGTPGGWPSGGRGATISGGPAIGGIRTGSSGLPQSLNTWASQWAPTGGDIGTTGISGGPPSFTYDQFAGGSSPYVDWGDPYLQDLMGGGGGFDTGGFEDYGDLGGFYDYSPAESFDYSGYA